MAIKANRPQRRPTNYKGRSFKPWRPRRFSRPSRRDCGSIPRWFRVLPDDGTEARTVLDRRNGRLYYVTVDDTLPGVIDVQESAGRQITSVSVSHLRSRAPRCTCPRRGNIDDQGKQTSAETCFHVTIVKTFLRWAD